MLQKSFFFIVPELSLRHYGEILQILSLYKRDLMCQQIAYMQFLNLNKIRQVENGQFAMLDTKFVSFHFALISFCVETVPA